MANRLFLLLLAAWLGVAGGQAQKRTEVSHYVYQRELYADADGDGALEHIEKLQGKVYDYPAGSLPGGNSDGAYYNIMGETDMVRIIDGAYYYRFHMITAAVMKDGSIVIYEPGMEELDDFVTTKLVYEGTFATMAVPYPEGREPDIKEGADYWFRITSQADVDAWLNYDPYASGWSKSTSEWSHVTRFLFHDGKVWEYAGTAPHHYDTRLAWVDFNGNVRVYIDGTEEMNVFAADLNADYNADGVTDVFVCSDGEDSPIMLAMSGPDGYTLTATGLNKGNAFELGSIVTDLNRDGRPDIFGWETITGSGTVTTHNPMTFIQMADGTFMRRPLNVVTDETEISGAAFSSGGKGTFSTSYINMSGMSGGKGSDYAGEKAVMKAADINLDGYPDLIDPSGHSFLSLPDGRYYSATFAGSVVASDLNGDGISDLVIFDKPNSQVVLNLSSGTGFETTQLIENGNISAMYCRDLDGDGRLDILLCMDTPRSGTHAYLAFFSNNGDGTFRRTVRTLEGEYEFNRLIDINNNGRPTIVATFKTPSYSYKRIDWDDRFAITMTGLFPKDADAPIFQNGSLWDFMDYDGDGQVEILASLTDDRGYSKTYLYAPATAQPNTAPQRMAAPGVITDRSNGLVKIEWAQGSDKESAACDLIYNVRVSRADGTNVLLTECDGRQLIANAGSWPMEQMGVSVRAADPNGRCGEWSETVTFANETANALFTMSHDRMTTADTLIVKTVDGSEATFSVLPDGTVKTISGGHATIVFDKAGSKTVTATAAGGGSTTMKIDVDPLKTIGMYEAYEASFYNGGFDLDSDGRLEGLDHRIHTFDGQKYTYYPAFSLSDVNIHPTVFTDYDMDGRPDIFGTSTKNNKPCPWLVNDGDLEFRTVTDGFTDNDGNALDIDHAYISHMADFDNDGLLDFIHKGYIYRSLGGNKVQQIAFPYIEGWQPNEVYGVVDFNRDGLTDIVMRYYDPNYKSSSERFSTYILRNDGNMTFNPIPVFERRQAGITSITDIDGDGQPDFVLGEYLGNDQTKYTAQLMSRDLKPTETIELPGIPIAVDLDNDGQTDYILPDRNDPKLMLSSMNGSSMDIGNISVFMENLATYEPYDFNADGRPDHKEALMLSRFSNTAPTAPSTVFANTVGRYVAVSWDGATDSETPTDRLRYNVSVKKKGAKGSNSYVISPLNATDSRAITAPTGYPHFRYGTKMEIPVDRFEAGTAYEICVQAVDPWYAHSPFSETIEFTPQATALISMAQKGGVDMPMPIQIYDNSGAEPTIDADGGIVSGNLITWSTPGLKTVKVTAGAAQAEHRILIADRPLLRITLPARILAGQPLTVSMPEALTKNEGVKFRLWASDGMDAQYDATTNTAMVKADTEGQHTLYITYTDDIFTSPLSEYAETEAIGAGFTPELTMVGVDAATGRNRISWNAGMALPDGRVFTGKVAVYRETNVADNFEKLAEADLTDGGYTDPTSRPDIQSSRYMIALPTTYGTESAPSDIHGSIHLMVNRGMGNDINLHWTPYEGARISQYTILCGTSAANLQPIETLSGHAQSYTHRRSSDATTYYSVAYTLQQPARTAASRTGGMAAAPSADDAGGASNVISSNEAYAVTMVESIVISVRENATTLGKDNPQLHLTATVLPMTATIGNVEWSITSGESLATIAPDGTLSVLDNTAGGTVTVRARAIDGSAAEETMDFQVEAYSNGISGVTAQGTAPTVKAAQGAVLIDGIEGSVPVTVLNAGGSIVYRTTARAALRIPLQPGLYIVKAGPTVRKVGIR